LQYFSSTQGVDKKALGDYLGEEGDFNMEVLKAFTALQDFANKDFLEVYSFCCVLKCLVLGKEDIFGSVIVPINMISCC
jgi:Sec7-like guanine-nucleotide exchange factor